MLFGNEDWVVCIELPVLPGFIESCQRRHTPPQPFAQAQAGALELLATFQPFEASGSVPRVWMAAATRDAQACADLDGPCWCGAATAASSC